MTRGWRCLFAFVFAVAGCLDLRGGMIESASPGTTEIGVPTYEILAAESLGLDTAPTDLREMPDGRILLVAGTQLALGDGVRWQVFRQNPGTPTVRVTGAVVDRDGTIYVGLTEGVAAVEFGEDGYWRPHLQAAWASSKPGVAETMPQATVQVLANEWVWHSLTGSLQVWRPGQPMRLAGFANTFEHVFRLDDHLYISQRADGALSRVDDGRAVPLLAAGSFSAITCSQPLGLGRELVGTYGRGLRIFDGQAVREFTPDDLFSHGWRINDLCRIDGGYFAAALENYGVVFLGEDGRVTQVLDRDIDNRLTRVTKLLAGRGGLLWGLLEAGVFRVRFPSNLSNFEAMLGSGMTTVHPYRFEGQLWLLADGRLFRGVYDPSDRLVRFDLDGPNGLFVNAFSNVGGRAVAGTEGGAYVRTSRGWENFAPAAVYFRVIDSAAHDGRWLFVARNRVGWAEPAGDGVRIVAQYEVPELGNPFNKPVRDAAGRVWLELGIGRVGCVAVEHGTPTVRLYTEKDGLAQNWPQLFLDDGAIAVHVADAVYRFDQYEGRFVPDAQYLARLPGAHRLFGRPGVDPAGRLWVVVDGALQVRARHGDAWDQVVQTVPLNYEPYYPTFEPDGTVWMHAQHRLTRIDPRMPAVKEPPLGAHLTQLSVAGGHRQFHRFGAAPLALAFADNSVVARFVARGNTLGSAVTFEIRLEGASSAEWLPVGSAGLASFDHLKEGDYVLHVRPRLGETIGIEDVVAFTIQPPWYRTPFAYFTYGLAVLLAVLLAIWGSTVLERRENLRLERIVAERTAELRLSNENLGRKMEEIRTLTQAIAQSPVAIFITDAAGRIEFTNPRSSELTGLTAEELTGRDLRQLRPPTSDPAALAQIAEALARGESWSGELALNHRTGRTVPVRSTVSPIFRQDGSVRHHLYLEDDIAEWLDEQQRRRRLEGQLSQAQRSESLGRLAGGIAHDFNNILTGILGFCEMAGLTAEEGGDVRVDLQQIRAAGLRAKDLVTQILAFSRQNPTTQSVIDLLRPVEEALKLIRATTPATIEIETKLASGNVRADATQIHQVLVNLCTNAMHAIGERPGRLVVTLRPIVVDAERATEINGLSVGLWMRLTVSDTGHGMDAATLERIFDPFFTTKAPGQGTGLGLSIVQSVVTAHGGALQVHSEVGAGTLFELYFPLVDQPVDQALPTVPPDAGQGEEILLVDDERMVGEFALARLTHFGYRPSLFTDPAHALASFRAGPFRYAAVVTDLTMPGLTGLDLVRALRTQSPDLPAVVLTGHGSDGAREAILRLPRCRLVPKPFTGEELAQALSSVLSEDAADADE